MKLEFVFDFDYDFELELSYSDIQEFLGDFTYEDIYRDGMEYFHQLPAEEQSETLSEWGITDEVDVKNNKEFVEEILLELIEKNINDYTEEMRDYFYAVAKESYEDAKEYERDPWGYYGLSTKDFL